jgi:hypothetical protein
MMSNEMLRKMMEGGITKLLQDQATEANMNVSHADFVAGVRNGSMGFQCMGFEPNLLVRGVRRTILNVLVLSYAVLPIVVVPVWAWYYRDWWLLLGVPAAYAGSFSATWRSKLIYVFFCLCVGVWLRNGFSTHQFITFFFFWSLWGYMLFLIAEHAQEQFSIQSLVENPDLFQRAVAHNKIKIVRRDD